MVGVYLAQHGRVGYTWVVYTRIPPYVQVVYTRIPSYVHPWVYTMVYTSLLLYTPGYTLWYTLLLASCTSTLLVRWLRSDEALGSYPGIIRRYEAQGAFLSSKV